MQQITLDYFKPHYSINQPVRLIELFAGIGSQAKALQKLGVDFEKWVVSEWEVNATKSYKAIHCENDKTDYSKGINQKELINALFSMGISNDGKEPMTLKQIARKNEKWLRETYNAYKATHNISNLMLAAGKNLNIVDIEKYVYILTYSFPCQDLSIAGKQAGMTKGSKTRSGLLWEVERLLKECKSLPQVLLMENVTQVHNKKNFADFKKWVECLENLGYSNYYADLNAKDYGVPQNRNRTFMISILGDYYYQFPEPFKLQKRLKDILETNVDEKYYLSLKAKEYITNPKRMANNFTNINSDIAIPITAKGQNNWTGSFIADERTPKIEQVAQLYPNSGNPQNGRVISSDGISYSLKTPQGGNSQPMIIEKGDSIDIAYPNSTKRRGRHIKGMALDEQNGYIRTDGCVGIVMTDGSLPKHNNRIIEPANSLDNFKVRKLTPKECLRLMTFDDADYEKLKAAGISDSAIYKEAGNSIVVNVMVFIFAMLFNKEVAIYDT